MIPLDLNRLLKSRKASTGILIVRVVFNSRRSSLSSMDLLYLTQVLSVSKTTQSEMVGCSEVEGQLSWEIYFVTLEDELIAYISQRVTI